MQIVMETTLGGTDISRIDPYENWEEATRRPGALGATPLWKPVYIEVTPDLNHPLPYASSAVQLILLIAGQHPQTRISQDAMRSLLNLIYADLTGTPKPRFQRLFLMRQAAVAYDTLPHCAIRHVGPAFAGETTLVNDPLLGAFHTRFAALPQGSRAAKAVSGVSPGNLKSMLKHARFGVSTLPALADVAVTGIIDGVIAVANQRFCLPGNGPTTPRTTRVQRYWMQSEKFGNSTGLLTLGSEWDQAALNSKIAAFSKKGDLDEGAFYNALHQENRAQGFANLAGNGYLRPHGFNLTHGTHVLDVAAGWPVASARADRPILAVQLPERATAETWGGRLDFHILAGIIRLLHWADNWTDATGTPCRAELVINLSYGSYAGPKDGSGFLESEIARLIRYRNEEGVATAVAMPAGNSFRARCHGKMTLQTGQNQYLDWQILPEDQSVSFLEIWLTPFEQATLTITPPGQAAVDLPLLNTATADVPVSYVTDFLAGPETTGRAYVQHFSETGRTRIMLALAPSQNHEKPAQAVSPGGYRLTLTNTGTTRFTAEFDVQRDDTPQNFPVFARQSYLDHPTANAEDPETGVRDLPQTGSPVSRLGTLSSFANDAGDDTYVVGGALGRDTLARAALYASGGPTPGRAAPDLAAVSDETRAHVGILASGTFSGAMRPVSGTSISTPQVTRKLVESFAAGHHRTTVAGVQISRHNKARGMADLAATQPVNPAPDFRLGGVTLPIETAPGRVARRL